MFVLTNGIFYLEGAQMEQLTVIKALFLGILQGATEFLPVSSSGHLVIAQGLMNIKLENGVLAAFDVCLHFGTLLAIVAVFWRDVLQIFAGFLTRAPVGDAKEFRKLGIFLILGTLPAVILGLSFKKFFENLFEAPLAAGFMLLITGAILWSTRYSKDKGAQLSEMRWWHSLVVGLAQAVAIIPGISRSGSTISGGLFLGFDRTFAAKFAFLLAVPAIAGAGLLEIKELGNLTNEMLMPTIVGTAAAAIVGFACIKWLLGIIRRGHFSWFAYYCWAVGITAIIFFSIKG